jgi:hypothetical protein
MEHTAPRKPMKEPRIQSVSALKDYVLRITWVNGLVSNISKKADIFNTMNPGLAPLQEPAVFAHASTEFGWTVAWPDEDIQIGADTLWADSLMQSGKENAARFYLFRLHNGLSLGQAAEAFDMSRRMMAAYSSGARPLPRTLRLAMKGLEAERRGLL